MPRFCMNDTGGFYRHLTLSHQRQEPQRCVATCLAIITGRSVTDFPEPPLDKDDPVSWSENLKRYGMKLAYCPTDIRKLKHYADELLKCDDLFLVGYYTRKGGLEVMLEYPCTDGDQAPSHLVVLHRHEIINPGKEANHPEARGPLMARKCLERHTKRIFRVVPQDHPRGL